MAQLPTDIAWLRSKTGKPATITAQADSIRRMSRPAIFSALPRPLQDGRTERFISFFATVFGNAKMATELLA
jgi:hypothetical protein